MIWRMTAEITRALMKVGVAIPLGAVRLVPNAGVRYEYLSQTVDQTGSNALRCAGDDGDFSSRSRKSSRRTYAVQYFWPPSPATGRR